MELITKMRFDQINQVYESISVYRSVILYRNPIDDLLMILKNNDYPIGDRMYVYDITNEDNDNSNIEWTTINFIICIGDGVYDEALKLSDIHKFSDHVVIINI